MVERLDKPVAKKASSIKEGEVFYHCTKNDDDDNLLVCEKCKSVYQGRYTELICHRIDGKKAEIHDVIDEQKKAYVVIGKEIPSKPKKKK